MNVNLTLSVDDDVLERARRVAEHQGTSLNALVRQYIERLAGKASGPELAAMFREMFAKPAGVRSWKWNREELYEERIDRRRR